MIKLITFYQAMVPTHDSNSFTVHAIRTWNFFQNKLMITKLHRDLTPQ